MVHFELQYAHNSFAVQFGRVFFFSACVVSSSLNALVLDEFTGAQTDTPVKGMNKLDASPSC